MRIAVNLFLASPTSVTGAFVYIQNIVPELARAGEQDTFYLVGHADTIRYFKARFGQFRNVRYRTCDIRRDVYAHPWRALRKLVARMRKDNEMRERIVQREVQAFLRKERIDLYFSPSGVIYPRGLRDVRNVTTILDLQPEYFPQHFSERYLTERRRDALYATEHSERIIAISEYTKRTVVETYGIPAERVTTIYLAPPILKPIAAELPLPEEFLLYPAALWPHKNHRTLIEALDALQDRFPSLQVICTGAVKRPKLKEELELFARARGIGERVHFLGYVPDGAIPELYARAKVLVFPSSFEGFGIPLIEAFQAGLPVIAADNSSITEVVSGAGILVPTGDATALAQAIESVVTDETLRSELILKGRERARQFSWQKTANETLAVFAK